MDGNGVGNFEQFKSKRSQALFLGTKKVNTIEAYHDNKTATNLLFVTEATCVRVYAVYENSMLEMVSFCGYVSEQLSKKDI